MKYRSSYIPQIDFYFNFAYWYILNPFFLFLLKILMNVNWLKMIAKMELHNNLKQEWWLAKIFLEITLVNVILVTIQLTVKVCLNKDICKH